MSDLNIIVCKATPEHPRYGESSLLPFDDGRLFLAYTDFYGGNCQDEGAARIMGKWSHDQGQTWSDPVLVQENTGQINVMEASLLRLPGDRVMLAFLQKNEQKRVPGQKMTYGMLFPWVKVSEDECQTWSDPVRMIDEPGYWCGCHDRLIRLRSGRILFPVGHCGYAEGPEPAIPRSRAWSHTWYSDDDGSTWQRSRNDLRPPEGARYAEPVVVELPDDSLLMMIRTDAERLHAAKSVDGGETWELVNNSGPPTTFAPCMVKLVPGTEDLLLIWNNHLRRTNLTAALSHDGGGSWVNFRIVEEAEAWPDRRMHAYPTLAFQGEYAHMTYWEIHAHQETGHLFDLVYRRLPISWFYEQRPRRAVR